MNYVDNKNKDLIYNTLLEDIMSMKYPPGSFLKEAELSQRFSVSRTPIREVIKRLAQEQYIEVIPRHGNLVSLIDLDYVKQLMEMRIVLEGAVIKNIIMSPEEVNLDKERENLQKQEILLAENNVSKFFDIDNEFHQNLFEADDKLIWWQSLKKFETHYMRYRTLDMQDNVDISMLYTHHKNLLMAIDKRDTVMAIEILRSHIGICLQRMPVLIKKYPDYFKKVNYEL